MLQVSFIADQVRELQAQIAEERSRAVSEQGRDLNTLAIQEAGLKSDVEFLQNRYNLLDSLLIIVVESQRQLKFVVVLASLNCRLSLIIIGVGRVSLHL